MNMPQIRRQDRQAALHVLTGPIPSFYSEPVTEIVETRPMAVSSTAQPDLTGQGVERASDLTTVQPMHLQFVEPSKRYADVIVLRHNEQGAAKRAAAVSSVPVINAGDGPGQHPTQALLDLYTIRDELGHVDGIRIAMVGDLANGRTVRSLTYLLSKFRDIRICFVAPPQVAMKDDIKDHLDEHHVPWVETEDLDAVLPQVDVIYQTRIQKERFSDEAAYLALKGIYRIDASTLGRMKKDAIVMHPLPRVDEIAPEVDADPRAAYFRQARNGLYIRMALLDKVLA